MDWRFERNFDDGIVLLTFRFYLVSDAALCKAEDFHRRLRYLKSIHPRLCYGVVKMESLMEQNSQTRYDWHLYEIHRFYFDISIRLVFHSFRLGIVIVFVRSSRKNCPV